MKKHIIALAVALLATLTGVRADTSYLLIQGPFGTAGATETFDWAVNYQPGQLLTGFDLLTAALTSNQFQYTAYSFGDEVDGFTLGGTSVQNGSWTTNPDGSGSGLSWTYYTAGAADGAWAIGEDGASATDLSNGSYDGWVYGLNAYDADYNPTATPAIDNGTGANAPLTTDFSGATAVHYVAVPEPTSTALAFIGACGVLALYRRRRG